jgi:glycosyltransferase involved in cell wall biosynthesis
VSKICIFVPSFQGGGAEKVAINLANYYSSNYDVTILVLNQSGPYKKQLGENIELINLSTRARYSLIKTYIAFKKIQPDIIISILRECNIIAGLTLIFRPVKSVNVVFSEQNPVDNLDTTPFYYRYFILVLMKISYNCANVITANSRDTQNSIANYIGYKNKFKVIGNPITTEKTEFLCDQQINHKWLNNDKYQTVLNVGRLHHQKDQLNLLKVFIRVNSIITESRLLILGEGSESDNLHNFIDENNLCNKVEIIDFVQNPFPFYKASKVFALTSRWEGFGNVLVESLYCGTPVVSYDCPGGPKEIIDSEILGTLVHLGDVEMMTQEIVKLLKAKKPPLSQLREKMMKYSVETIASKYIEEK